MTEKKRNQVLEPRLGDVKHTKANIDKIKNIGFIPVCDVWDGLQKTLNWWGLSKEIKV